MGNININLYGKYKFEEWNFRPIGSIRILKVIVKQTYALFKKYSGIVTHTHTKRERWITLKVHINSVHLFSHMNHFPAKNILGASSLNIWRGYSDVVSLFYYWTSVLTSGEIGATPIFASSKSLLSCIIVFVDSYMGSSVPYGGWWSLERNIRVKEIPVRGWGLQKSK